MSLLFECEYRGERFVGFERPAPNAPTTLYRVREGQLRAAILGAGPGGVGAVVTAESDPVIVPATAASELRFRPPLLPEHTGNALLSGFMRTHEKKWVDAPPHDETNQHAQWFFKGFGSWLRLPGETLTVPSSAVALIEEPEVVLVYVNDDEGRPHYVGYTFGNDLCDIGLHRLNPIYNSYCKLCDTSISPWLFLGEPPESVTGRVAIDRADGLAWEGTFRCGAEALHFPAKGMADNLLSYPALHRPGLVNYLLLGADEASFHDGFRLTHGDRVTIEFASHDVVLENTVRWADRISVA
ncbi:fumarylacetoacetate (FAA) hydrolase [Nocardia bovistercoris]|uniref:Fumarylacetoacetate (FAA) hydrolase n=1 Tax=Nocardia bovistercoris TaxID=2785916 RepID=A0A931IDQ3_9NOCA|nr:fumarylacetoacetate (FAA) hydrolase [Nocardia bovistercoris]MBH0779291.1 hypothetical protein [Nocardia bovistercoris]